MLVCKLHYYGIVYLLNIIISHNNKNANVFSEKFRNKVNENHDIIFWMSVFFIQKKSRGENVNG